LVAGLNPARVPDDETPLVRSADVVHIGRRDVSDPVYGSRALQDSKSLDLRDEIVRARGPAAIAELALERVAGLAGGFWIHLDADVLDPRVMPAVDGPLPGGLDFGQAAALLRPLLAHPGARGLQLTIYDPTKIAVAWELNVS
jgi:arginase